MINAYDTETYRSRIFLITDAVNKEYVFDFDMTTVDILAFLYETAKEKNFFYNINFDFGAIVKPYLSQSDYSKFLEKKTIELEDFYIRYINGKAFSLRYREKTTKYFYDIANFYMFSSYYLPLDKVAEMFLNKHKMEDIDRERLAYDYNYILENKEKVIEYCKTDSQLTKELAELYINSVVETFKLMPRHYYSKASISKVYLDQYHPNLIEMNKILRKNRLYREYDKYIRNAYRGGIFNVNILGKVDNVIDIDINSAYPSFIAKIPALNDFEIYEVDKFDRDAFTGAYKVYVRYNHFLPYRSKNLVIYPVSKQKLLTYLSHEEVKFMLDNFPSDIKIVDGITLHLNSDKLEFSDIVDIYEMRRKLKQSKDNRDKIRQWNLKVVMNAIYGVLAQQRPHFTKFTNLLLASYITASTRVKIYNEILKVGWDNIIQIATDGILLKNVAKYEENDVLGEFALSGVYDYEITYMNGLYLLSDGQKIYLKKRGFKDLKVSDLLTASGHVLKIKQRKAFRVLESLRQHEPDKINQFLDVEKELNLLSNLQKNDIDVDKLTFEYLNENSVYVEPIFVSEPEDFI